ncbi:uncharacterized protein [Asterias amurensis]|uniref:uncharacterized protein n=1 Tax=Asterias amurensis TaxID=7602 RepID=UPI003AB72F49
MATTAPPEETVPVGNETDTSVIITVAACIGGLFLIVIIIFIAFVIYFYKKQMRHDEQFDKTVNQLKNGELSWSPHALGQQFGDVNDIDEMLWREAGRNANAATSNPAFGKDFEPLDVNTLTGFDSLTDDAVSTQETGSTSDMVEIPMEEPPVEDVQDDVQDENGEDSETQEKKQISILDMKTWGQPGSSRHNSMRRGFTSPFAHKPPPPEEEPSGSDYGYDRPSGSFRSQEGSTFPGPSPFSVSNPSNDPRFVYTRNNPLVADDDMDSEDDTVDIHGSDSGFPYSSSNPTYEAPRVFQTAQSFGTQRAFEARHYGGPEDVDFNRSDTLRRSRRNQSVVDSYESGERRTSSSFNLSLEGTGDSIGKNRLWLKKKFAGVGGGLNTN